MDKIQIKNPGQRYVDNFIIYDALDGPLIDENKWHLSITGLVKNPRSYTYKELEGMRNIEYISDVNCVTKWSIKDAIWKGPSLKNLIMDSFPDESAEWVMFKCADNYDTPVQMEDILDEKSILALTINGEKLNQKQGFPARPFIPKLYGWKSAKWIIEIKLMKDYKDGFWEAYGYHQRGYVENEERFKGFNWKHVKRKSEILKK